MEAMGPPIRRGSREERREATVRALAAGDEAGCAYCGRPLPPIPRQGGRPTPYCPADPERYGRWGAKVVTCAMLDEQREIWVTVYGPDQPMTQLDTRALDEQLGSALSALDPLHAELSALRTHVTDQTAAALKAREEAEAARDEALEQVRVANAERAHAVTDAEEARAAEAAARKQSEVDREERDAALASAVAARKAQETALAVRDEAENNRQRALEQAAAAHDRVTALQREISALRATAVEDLEQARRTAAEAQQELRASLTVEHESRMREQEQRLREQAAEADKRVRGVQLAADQRVAESAAQVSQATKAYAETLAPLHAELAELRARLSARQAELDEMRRLREAEEAEQPDEIE
ncbi:MULTISPECIES: hypothetical protein [Amycolatopsis]|uniref:hypothetical protein n=1 Tax=Amycolatopsis TaxID=1813 RepID=UPI0007E2050E|nr:MULTISPECIES: hypothetical protein [Amycolatopsis]OAP22655.1 hypothetical protein A4R44_06522 [Amycolatopsis sp. M39]